MAERQTATFPIARRHAFSILVLFVVYVSIVACTKKSDRIERIDSLKSQAIDSPFQVGMSVEDALRRLPAGTHESQFAILKGENEFVAGEPFGGIVANDERAIGLVYDKDLKIIEIHPTFREYERRGFKIE